MTRPLMKLASLLRKPVVSEGVDSYFDHSEFSCGDSVEHPDWGVGKLIRPLIWEDTYETIAFGWYVDFGEVGVIGCFERSLQRLHLEGGVH